MDTRLDDTFCRYLKFRAPGGPSDSVEPPTGLVLLIKAHEATSSIRASRKQVPNAYECRLYGGRLDFIPCHTMNMGRRTARNSQLFCCRLGNIMNARVVERGPYESNRDLDSRYGNSGFAGCSGPGGRARLRGSTASCSGCTSRHAYLAACRGTRCRRTQCHSHSSRGGNRGGGGRGSERR
jgi:hypothetical protein